MEDFHRESCTVERCYKKNLFVGIDPTYPAVKPITSSLIAQYEVETTQTSYGPSPEEVMKGEKER
jgi:hypothetical protein